MPNHSSTVEPNDREMLVAYLDGELSADECSEVEHRLAADEQLRFEVRQLQQSWDALDEIPRPTAAEDFTKTTLEMVTIEAARDVESATMQIPVQRRRRWIALSCAAAVAIVAGLLIGRAVWSDPNQVLLNDLPIIENLDAYRDIRDVAFLRQLHEQMGQRLAQVAAMGEQQITAKLEHWQSSQQATSDQRLERLASMPSDRADQLATDARRLGDLSDAETKRVHKLHEEIADSKDSASLLATMWRYQWLLETLGAAQRADLQRMAIDEIDQRLAKVDELLKGQEKLARVAISAADIRLITTWLEKYARDHIDDVVGPPGERDWFDHRPDSFKKNVLLTKLHERMRQDDGRRGRGWGGRRGNGRRERNDRDREGEEEPRGRDDGDHDRDRRRVTPIRFTDEDYQSLVATLSDEAQQRYQAAGDEGARHALAMQWIGRTFWIFFTENFKRSWAEVSQEELEQFFVEDLDPQTREELLLLPDGQMQSELRRLYFGLPSGGWQPGPPRGEGDGPRRGGGRSDGRPRRPDR